jgi:hypothetical protein
MKLRLRRIEDTEWFEQVYGSGIFGDSYRRKFECVKKFHWSPTKINNKIYWLRHSYYVKQIVSPMLMLTVNGVQDQAVDYIQISKKHYGKEPHIVYMMYYNLGDLKRV